MIGLRLTPRINTVFASRWKALWWSAGILMTAYCSVPDKGEEDPVVDVAIGMAQGRKSDSPAPEHHVNPWAKDAPATSG